MPLRSRGRDALGVIFLVVGLGSLGVLSLHLTGLAMIALGFGLLIAEVVVLPGSGLLVLSGLMSLCVGALLLMNGASPEARAAPWGVVGIIAALAVYCAIDRHVVHAVTGRPPTTGREGMLGEEGVTREELAPDGKIFVHGELWEASTRGGPIPRGAAVRVVGLEGLRVFVEPIRAQIAAERIQ